MESVSSLKHKMSALFYKIEGTYVGVDKPSRINLQKQDSKAGISPGEGRVPNGNICNLMLLHIRKISLATSKSTTSSQLWGGVEKKSLPLQTLPLEIQSKHAGNAQKHQHASSTPFLQTSALTLMWRISNHLENFYTNYWHGSQV